MADEMAGKHCKLLHDIRDAGGKIRSKEDTNIIVRSLVNLDRKMYLIQFVDNSTTFVFPDEITIID